MSDDQGDAEFEASLADLEGEGDEAALTAGADDTSLANRIESVQGTLSTLGMRVDALVTSTTSYRSALTDRLAEYSELVTKTARNQAADLEEYRRTTERTVSEVRRSLEASEDAIQGLAARLDELGAGGVSVDEAEGRRVVAEVRSILDAQERLGDFLTQSLDRFGETVQGQLQSSNATVTDGLERLHGTVTELGERLGAGLREDLMQLRAIASAIAERDLTDDVRAVRATVEDLAGRDVNAPVREDLAGLRDLVVALQTSDPAGQVRADLEPLRDGLDRVAARLDDDTDHRRLLELLSGLEGRLDSLAASDRTEELLGRLDAVASGEQVRGLAADLRAHVADALGGLDGDVLTAEMHHVRETLDQEAGEVAGVLERLQETLLDVASGEVVGALWDELRSVRASVDELARIADEGDGGADLDAALGGLRDDVARLGATLQPDEDAQREVVEGVARTAADIRALGADLAGVVSEIRSVATAVDLLSESVTAEPEEPTASGPDPALVTLQEHVQRLTDEVRALLDAAEVGDDLDEVAGGADTAGDLLGSVADDLAALRDELREGLVVEPSDDLTATLEALRTEIDGLQVGLETLPAMQSSLDALRSAIEQLEAAPAAAGTAEHDGGTSEDESAGELRSELVALRAAVEAVQAQLDEGLVLAEDVELPPPGAGADGGDAVVDQIAALRDHLSTEIDGLRAAIATSGGSAPAPEREPADEGPVYATVDPDTVDLLREEIRAAGSVSDEVVDALREELKSLRRRLAVKAQERVLSDDQVRLLADAVAERLAED